MSCVRRLGYREGLFFLVDCDGEPLYFFRLGQLLELLRVRGCRKGWRCDRPGDYVVEVEGVGREEAKSLYEARDLLLLMLRRLSASSSPQVSAAPAPRSAPPAPLPGA